MAKPPPALCSLAVRPLMLSRAQPAFRRHLCTSRASFSGSPGCEAPEQQERGLLQLQSRTYSGLPPPPPDRPRQARAGSEKQSKQQPADPPVWLLSEKKANEPDPTDAAPPAQTEESRAGSSKGGRDPLAGISSQEPEWSALLSLGPRGGGTVGSQRGCLPGEYHPCCPSKGCLPAALPAHLLRLQRLRREQRFLPQEVRPLTALRKLRPLF